VRRLAVVLLALAVAGCGSSSATISAKKLPSLVLSAKDVGSAYSEFANGKQSRIDLHAGPRQDPQRFGRRGGWIARYRRAGGTLETRGPLVVESRADLFPSSGAAKKDLDAYVKEYAMLTSSVGGARLDDPSVGDGAVAFRYGSGGDNFFVVAWRDANATASVVVEGAKVSLRDAVSLARKQEARIARAR
jgi:hypothetical protein